MKPKETFPLKLRHNDFDKTFTTFINFLRLSAFSHVGEGVHKLW